MHPEDFERARWGDCEEHALWGWLHFLALGREARFTAGFHGETGHAWVTLYGEAILVFESTSKRSGYRAEDVCVRPEYRPLWSVDGRLGFRWHGPKGEIPRIP